MNGKERFLTALGRREADCVPTFAHGMNEASIINIGKHFTEGLPEAKPVSFWSQEELLKVTDAFMIIHNELDIDGATAVPLDEEEVIDETHYRNEWGVVKERNPHGLDVPMGHPIKSPADLHSFKRPEPRPGLLTLMADLMRDRFEGKRAIVFSVEGPFTHSWYLRGMAPLFTDFVRNPDFVTRLARMATDYDRELIELGKGSGADVVIIEEDMADKNNPFMSPRHYSRFVEPYHRELVEHVHKLGMKALIHSDGNLWPLLDRLVGVGIDGLNPLEPNAGMDLKRVKAKYGDRICLLGNIDCGELLCNGRPEEVEAAVRQAIEDAAPGGGYILCDSNTVHPGIKPENFITMMRAAKRYGAYR